MKIEKIAVENYRTLEKVTIDFFGYYTAISGKNHAGKTALIKVLRHMFKDHIRERFGFMREEELVYREDKTQWVAGNPDIVLDYFMAVDRVSDPGLFQFIEKISEKTIADNNLSLRTTISKNNKDETTCLCQVDGNASSEFASKEILQKITSSSLALVHDSAAAHEHAIYFGRNKFLHELIFSADERKQLSDEQKKIQKRVQSISRAHRTELSELLGHLEDKYEIEFAIPDGMFTGNLPFAINLKDKNVDVPLDDWGSGTKNRTQIMMSILQAHRVQSKDDQNRITPIVMIEEPESFLHPSAQAEFGRVLRKLASDLKIQTIVTTHSPYMLCQDNVKSNVLLARKLHRGKLKQSEPVELHDATWMEPFSEILGLDNSEFAPWKSVLGSTNNCVLLVEGEIDKKYLQHIHSLGHAKYQLPENLDILPYEGKDALKNAILVKFITQKFKRVFITFDLDAKSELDRTMQQVGLGENVDYMAIGVEKPGRQCIEGLVPDRVLSAVYAQNPDLVMQLSAQDAKERKSAKSSLKQKILAAFQAEKTMAAEDLKGFGSLFKSLHAKVGTSVKGASL